MLLGLLSFISVQEGGAEWLVDDNVSFQPVDLLFNGKDLQIRPLPLNVLDTIKETESI
jgi:hypothetical protein